MEQRAAVLLMRHLRLRHIELLNVLSRSRTMHAASNELKLSQPAISKMLREIESTFGASLFERSKSGIRPTAAGSIAIRLAHIIFNEVSIAADEISMLQGAGHPVLRLGTVSVTSLVPQAITLLRRSVPDAIVQIREGPVDALVERLLSAELDCVVGALDPGFLGRPEMSDLAASTVLEDRLCIVASPKHPMAKAKRLSWSDVSAGPWVLPPSETVLRHAFAATFLQQGLVSPRPTVETLSPITLAAIVRNDPDLLGVLRNEQFRTEQDYRTLVELAVSPLAPLPPFSLFTRRKRSPPPPLLDAFHNALKQAAKGRLR